MLQLEERTAAGTAALHTVSLTLARSVAFPGGSLGRGYRLVAPLDADGHLDVALWQGQRDRCRVRRFWTGEPDRYGLLVHRTGGYGAATWGIDCDDPAPDGDEAGWHLGTHRLAEGEYVSVRNLEEDVRHTFRVTFVGPAQGGRS